MNSTLMVLSAVTFGAVAAYAGVRVFCRSHTRFLPRGTDVSPTLYHHHPLYLGAHVIPSGGPTCRS